MLHLQGDLEVVARRGLVVRGGGQLGVEPAGQVVRVHVVDARSGSIEGRRVVEGEGHHLLAVLLHRLDDVARARQAAEDRGGDGERALDVLRGPRHERLLGGRLVGRVRREGRTVRRHVVAEALGTRDGPPLLVDGRKLVQAHLVHVRGRDVQRRPLADGEAVHLLAVLGAAQARQLTGDRQGLVAEHREVALVRRPDHVPHHGGDPLAVRLGRDLGHRHEHALLERRGELRLHEADGLLHHDPRRRVTCGQRLAGDLDVLRHVRRIRVEAGEPGLEPLRGAGRLEDGELAQRGLRALHVVDGAEVVVAERLALRREVCDGVDDVAGDPVLEAHLGLRDGVALRSGGLQHIQYGGTAGGADVVEAGVELRVAGGVDGHRRGLEREDAVPQGVGDGVDARGSGGHLGTPIRAAGAAGGTSIGASVPPFGRTARGAPLSRRAPAGPRSARCPGPGPASPPCPRAQPRRAPPRLAGGWPS